MVQTLPKDQEKKSDLKEKQGKGGTVEKEKEGEKNGMVPETLSV